MMLGMGFTVSLYVMKIDTSPLSNLPLADYDMLGLHKVSSPAEMHTTNVSTAC